MDKNTNQEQKQFSTEDLFLELKEAAEREGISSFVQYKDLVDELVEEKMILGLFGDDGDSTQIKEDLLARWPEIEKGLKNCL